MGVQDSKIKSFLFNMAFRKKTELLEQYVYITILLICCYYTLFIFNKSTLTDNTKNHPWYNCRMLN